jgi:thiamine-phosphate pyrophosphorylase
MAPKPLAACRLYTFIDLGYVDGSSVERLAAQLCEGGSDLIQLRAKNSPVEAVKQLADKIVPILERAGVGLVINDHPELAREFPGVLCHLGQEDFFDSGYSHVSELSRRSGGGRESRPELKVGLSTHEPAQAERAVAAGASYIAIGPVFATPTKPKARPVALEYVRWAARHIRVPWFAIGGITLENLDAVLEAGARGICVVSAILKASDVVRACQGFRDRLLSAGHDRAAS